MSKEFVSAAPQGGSLLEKGKHLVKLVTALFITSNHLDLKGTLKDKETPWNDAGEQLAITVRNNDGVHTERFNFDAYRRFSELSEKEKETGKITLTVKGKPTVFNVVPLSVDGSPDYACIETKQGYIRLQDEERQQKGWNRIFQLFKALGIPEGSKKEAILDYIGTEFEIVLKGKEYNGKEYLEISSMKAVKSEENEPA